jgi:hypothetical protein
MEGWLILPAADSEGIFLLKLGVFYVPPLNRTVLE